MCPARQQSDTILFQKPNSGRTSMNAMQAQAQAQQLRKPVNLDAFDPFSTNLVGRRKSTVMISF